MESYQIQHLTFSYPNGTAAALHDITLSISQGEFVTLCGKSGCGKSTLLRQLKPVLSPHGTRSGDILFLGQPLTALDDRMQSAQIGFVLQSPDNQIVTDKVWHELAFGLESLGFSTPEIRARVSEMASFFGIQTWFHKKITELSGGQKQLLNLAAIMAMQPSVLLLDEPTSQLDPIAAQEFLETIAKINRELGTTILLTEHRLEEAFPMSDRVLVMDHGAIIADGSPKQVGEALKRMGHDMFVALPAAMRIYAGVDNHLECPVTVREGRDWLEKISKTRALDSKAIPESKPYAGTAKPLLELKDIWFRYGKEQPDVVKGLSVKVNKGELYAVVGGNGTGKTTMLSLMNGLLTPYRGEVLLDGQPLNKIQNKYNGLLGVLPQNPQAMFVKKTVELDLYEVLSDSGLSKTEKAKRVQTVAALCELEDLLLQHPYDLSGGEQQRAALAKVLLLQPQILFLDEPTKGLDAYFKETFANILYDLKASGVTILMVSHDIEFCAKYADRCAMFFDGAIVSEDCPRKFFSGKNFYTTSVNRMARTILPEAVLAEDVILACGGSVVAKRNNPRGTGGNFEKKEVLKAPNPPTEKLTPKKIIWGSIFGALFVLTVVLFYGKYADWRNDLFQFTAILELAICLINLIPQKQLDAQAVQLPQKKGKLSKRSLVAAAMIVLVIPLTIYIGIHYWGDKKYSLISLLIMLETMLPFALMFERRKPQARELIVISVLCAIAVAGRAAFFMLPQFKPVVAIVIIAGVCFGGEAGFLVGAVTGFVSNFLFGQGPWTPWQMFSLGVIGFLAGILFQKGMLRKTKGALCTYGGLATILLYGGIMNSASVIMWQAKPNAAMFLSAYFMGLPFDLIHAAATMFFLWFISAPMIEKLDRIKIKYGLIVH